MSFGDDVDDGLGDRNDFLQELIDREDLSGAALGVTRKVIAEGEGSLIGDQKREFKRVLDLYVTEECPRHGYRIPWNEMYEFHHSGKCCWCERDDERRAKE